MRRHVFIVVSALAACGAIGVGRTGSEQKKPIDLSYGNTYFIEPPPSLREMALAADAVVFGRILAGVARGHGFHRKSEPGITTFYRFQVEEILQSFGGRPVDDKELTIVRDGGAIDRGSRIEKLEIGHFPQFAVGQHYVLFLRWHQEHQAWTPHWGPHGTFEAQAGRIHSIGFAKIARDQNGATVDQFLTAIRRL